MVTRVDATEQALSLITKLEAMHGPLMFHQSGGCCDGSAPMCYPRGDFRVGRSDVKLGEHRRCTLLHERIAIRILEAHASDD